MSPINQKHLQLHKGQMEVFKDDSRFRVVVSGRRWGKTALSKIEILREAVKPNRYIWYVAPTYRMAKQIMQFDLLDAIPRDWVVKQNDTFLTLKLVNGTRIELKGADSPDTLRGVGLNFLVLDEFQDMTRETWTQVLRPTLADKHGRALFIGSPKSYNLLYDVYMLGQKGVPGWKSWQFPTITSPFIPKSEIEMAKNDMDEKSFLQEFCHVASTKVMKTDDSVCSIKDLRVFDQLWYECGGKRLSCSVIDVRCTGQKAITKLILENGETFRASSDHKLKVHEDGAAKKVSMRDAQQIERWDENGHLSKIAVIDRQDDGFEETYNITVDSPDHSYLLADGTNNYNCASFEVMSGRVYYAFDRNRHVKPCPFNEKLPIQVGMDFNIDPMSTVIMQPQTNGDVWCVDEIVQFSSSTTDICHELERRYQRWLDRITVYPDPAGGARQHARGESDLDIMRDMGFTRIKAKSAHPPVADRVNAVNRMLMSADGTVRLYIDPKCRRLITALEQTIYIPGGRDIDKSQGIEHSADALGYAMDIEFPTKKIALVGYSR